MFLKIPKYPKNPKGFTVLELTVVISITVILLLIFLANFRGFENRSALDYEADKLVSVIKQAQMLALTGQTIGNTRYNYGVHLYECISGACRYILFSDLNGDNDYDAGEEYSQGTFIITQGVYIDVDDLTIDSSIVDPLNIVFEAPFGNTYFNDSQVQDQAQIILSSSHYDGQKTITINRVSGQINVE